MLSRRDVCEVDIFGHLTESEMYSVCRLKLICNWVISKSKLLIRQCCVSFQKFIQSVQLFIFLSLSELLSWLFMLKIVIKRVESTVWNIAGCYCWQTIVCININLLWHHMWIPCIFSRWQWRSQNQSPKCFRHVLFHVCRIYWRRNVTFYNNNTTLIYLGNIIRLKYIPL